MAGLTSRPGSNKGESKSHERRVSRQWDNRQQDVDAGRVAPAPKRGLAQPDWYLCSDSVVLGKRCPDCNG
jgi:hypothetical protein